MLNNKPELQAVAFDESIILAVKAKRKGTEEISNSGIILGTVQESEIPSVGVVVSVGNNVPDDVKEKLLNATVVYPNGRTAEVINPKVLTGELTYAHACKLEDKLIATHYKNIQVYYKEV